MHGSGRLSNHRRFAPFETQLDFDNAGLLLGSPDRPVTRIVTALEVCEGVVREAVAAGAQLLVTHHPVFFQPVKRLVETEPEARNVCALIRAGISLIAAHTNFDMAEGGVNDALAAQLGWQVQRRESLLRFGCFEGPRTLESLQMQASDALGWPVIRYGATRYLRVLDGLSAPARAAARWRQRRRPARRCC